MAKIPPATYILRNVRHRSFVAFVNDNDNDDAVAETAAQGLEPDEKIGHKWTLIAYDNETYSFQNQRYRSLYARISGDSKTVESTRNGHFGKAVWRIIHVPGQQGLMIRNISGTVCWKLTSAELLTPISLSVPTNATDCMWTFEGETRTYPDVAENSSIPTNVLQAKEPLFDTKADTPVFDFQSQNPPTHKLDIVVIKPSPLVGMVSSANILRDVAASVNELANTCSLFVDVRTGAITFATAGEYVYSSVYPLAFPDGVGKGEIRSTRQVSRECLDFALRDALHLDWRPDAAKVLIIAPSIQPEMSVAASRDRDLISTDLVDSMKTLNILLIFSADDSIRDLYLRSSSFFDTLRRTSISESAVISSGFLVAWMFASTFYQNDVQTLSKTMGSSNAQMPGIESLSHPASDTLPAMPAPKHEPAPFITLPDKLLVLVLAQLEPVDVLTSLALVSRRLARVCTTDELWAVFSARALGLSSTKHFLRQKWAPPGSQLIILFKELIREWVPRIGWWAEMEGMVGGLYRIVPDMTSGLFRCERIVASNTFESASPSTQHVLPYRAEIKRHIMSYRWPYTFYTHNSRLRIHLLDPVITFHPIFTARFDGRTGLLQSAHDGRVLPPSSVAVETIGPWDFPPTWDAFISSHYLLPPLGTPRNGTESLAQVHALRLDFVPRRLLMLRSPTSANDRANSLVRTGWYVGEYDTHGYEFLYVRTVFADNYGLGDDLPPSALYRSSVQRIEAIKLTGDLNVPKGQRSFVAFVPTTFRGTVPECSPGNVYETWPSHRTGRPLAVDYQPSGATLEGIGRVAYPQFSNPSWLPIKVHLASRAEIQVFWTMYGQVITYQRIDLDTV